MPRNDTNILELVFSRDRDLASAATQSNGDAAGGSASDIDEPPEQEMQAIASCLEYLYGESMRLGQRLPAHLIGAAAESLRQEVTRLGERPKPDGAS